MEKILGQSAILSSLDRLGTILYRPRKISSIPDVSWSKNLPADRESR